MLSCSAAQAGTIFGVTNYPPRVEAQPASVSAPPATLAPAPAQPRKRLSRRDRRLTRMAAGAVETTPSPTPSSSTTVQQQSAPADGPHEGAAPTINDLINRHANENGVPAKLASAVVEIESRFNPRARGGSAYGLMQIKVGTARSMGFSGGPASLLQPDTNLHFGMKVLADAYRSSHGDLCMTLAKYQSGHRTTRMSAANRSYCAKARQLMAKA